MYPSCAYVLELSAAVCTSLGLYAAVWSYRALPRATWSYLELSLPGAIWTQPPKDAIYVYEYEYIIYSFHIYIYIYKIIHIIASAPALSSVAPPMPTGSLPDTCSISGYGAGCQRRSPQVRGVYAHNILVCFAEGHNMNKYR